MKRAALLLVVILLAGCSTAGPFVSGISSDGKGGLIIQKGYVEMNGFTGTISNKEAGESTIKFLPEEEVKGGK